MIKKVTRRYFEVWGTEEAQNVFLKGLLLGLSVLFIAQSAALVMLACRKPVLVAVGATESKVMTLTQPREELLESELKRVLKQYAEFHYSWDYSTIEKSHAKAASYVAEKFVKSFILANAEQVRLAREKKVSERVYLSGEILIDLKTKTARVPLDRIFTVEGIRAAGPLKLEIGFDYGPRTIENPEGIYVVSEALIPQSKDGG